MPHVSRLLDPAMVEQLNRLSLAGRRVVEGNTLGTHRSILRGASVEFRQHRAYVPGDEPRRLDWRLLGRTDRLFVREYEEETNLRCLILIDRSASMAYRRRFGSKLQLAIRLAAALAYLMLSRTESVGLASCERALDLWIPPRSHGRQLSSIIETLDRLRPGGRGDPATAWRQAADRLRRRGMVIVLSDFFAPIDSLRKGLARLSHDRHEVILLQTVDPDEIHFPFDRVSRFVGMEGERAIVSEPAGERAAYLKRFENHQQALKRLSRSMHAELMTCQTDRQPIDLLIQFLREHAER